MQASLGASPRPTTIPQPVSEGLIWRGDQPARRKIRRRVTSIPLAPIRAFHSERALNGRSSSEQGPEDRKDNNHDSRCPRDRLVCRCCSRAHRTRRLPHTSAGPLKTENKTGREKSPGRSNLLIRVWCQIVGDSARNGDHAGASPVALTTFVAVSSNQQDSGL